MTEKRKKLLIRISVALVVIWIGGYAVVKIVRYFTCREARQMAEAWLQQAQENAKPDLTADDAIRWLREHGAGSVYRGEKAWINGREIGSHTILGYRKVGEESLWTEPITVVLVFAFDTEWHFTEVNVEVRALYGF
jgi:hypothetical protein